MMHEVREGGAAPEPRGLLPDRAALRELVPLSSLSDERLEELVSLASLESQPAGTVLFRRGELDNQALYLLSGQVRLLFPEEDAERIVKAGTEEARHPLGDRQPRRATAVAMTAVTVLRVDANLLDYMLTWDQITALEGPEGDGEREDEEAGRRLRRLLRALPFRAVPPANLRRLLERIERVPVRAGDVVVRQGEHGDYYYLIDQGRARVTRTIELARLSQGAGFGEEALLSEGRRNATVTMETDGVLLRLSKRDFDTLLKEPVLHWIEADEARRRVNAGARWLDVRHAKEFHRFHLPGAVNLPLHELRLRLDELDPGTHYVCYCRTGRRASAAAFLLMQRGIEVSVLRGGLQALPQFRVV